MIVPMSAALGGLEVIRLRGLDPAEPGAPALDVDDQAGKIASRDIGDALLFQGNARRGGGGHDASAGARDAVDHVDGRKLAFRLQERAADLGHPFGHIGGNLRLRGDGVTEIMAAAGADRRFGDGFVSLHQNLVCHVAHLISPR